MNATSTSSSSSSSDSKDVQVSQCSAGSSGSPLADKSVASAGAAKVVVKRRRKIRSKLTALRKPAMKAEAEVEVEVDKGKDKNKGESQSSSSNGYSPSIFANIAPDTLIFKWFIVEGAKKCWFKGTYVRRLDFLSVTCFYLP